MAFWTSLHFKWNILLFKAPKSLSLIANLTYNLKVSLFDELWKRLKKRLLYIHALRTANQLIYYPTRTLTTELVRESQGRTVVVWLC